MRSSIDDVAVAMIYVSSPHPHARQDGNTALIWAACNGHLEVVRVMLAAGVDKEAKEKVGGIMGCQVESG